MKKWINYSKYTGEDLGIDAEDLLRALSDFFLDSGFNNPYAQFSEWNQHSLEDLKNAILRALRSGELFDPDRAAQIQNSLENMTDEQLSQLLDRLTRKLIDAGYVSEQKQGGGGGDSSNTRIDITDKSIDFLGFKTLKDLLGSVGRSSFGAHDTRRSEAL